MRNLDNQNCRRESGSYEIGLKPTLSMILDGVFHSASHQRNKITDCDDCEGAICIRPNAEFPLT